MSYADKLEDITREEWMDKLNNVHIQRADMNRLIMNYLVTGAVPANLGFVLKDEKVIIIISYHVFFQPCTETRKAIGGGGGGCLH